MGINWPLFVGCFVATIRYACLKLGPPIDQIELSDSDLLTLFGIQEVAVSRSDVVGSQLPEWVNIRLSQSSNMTVSFGGKPDVGWT